ncbi:hypothetical protein [Lachnobacterium bovis]|uniref:hypothetical protein n=1 Tax=Lachnobacterium bovis TaxID=140626 RepID=UPI002E8DF9F0|nr:hypothetical protein [Lachnobacterium bovis]
MMRYYLLKSIGYIHEGNLGIPGREAFAYEGKEHLQQASFICVGPQGFAGIEKTSCIPGFISERIPEAVDE